MADRQEQIAKLVSKLDYLQGQSATQTILSTQTSDQRMLQSIQENNSNLLLEIQHVKAQLHQLGVNPPPLPSTASTSHH